MEHNRENPPRILVVDDDQEVLTTIKEYLEINRFSVETASTGVEALQLLRSQSYDLLLTDIVMPDISGLGLIEIARREKSGLMIVAMTGRGKQVGELTKEKSPDYYLEKPFSLQHLSEVLGSALSRE